MIAKFAFGDLKHGRTYMPKYLISGSYTAEGLRGLQKDTASARRDAITQLVKSAGGSVECIYYAFGHQDVYGVVDLPDNAAASAVSVAVSASGLVKTQITPLLTVEEVDAALKKSVNYRPPGR
jgi:uncharacterized protein with GYD domain